MSEIDANDPDLKKLCLYSFDLLKSVLFNQPQTIDFPQKFKGKQYPLFVTWLKGENKSLRGCIGTFQSADLETNLHDFTLYSALKDSRFPPISQGEFSKLNCGISLLVNFEQVSNIYDWEIGKHGIEIDFDVGHRHYRGTFLPEVSKEQHWDQKTTLQYLIQKAGYYGDLKEVENLIKLRRYQSIKFNMDYNEYQKNINEN